ncbi:MAG: caspase family protein [Bacteroidetes bacterium]|nr:caspase family protein [Bacteroidota bacterium]
MKPQNSYALLIGVGQRPDDTPAIAVTAEDAARLATELNQRCGFPSGNIRPLRAGDASRLNILRQLDRLAADTVAQPADLVILFFSGHGLRNAEQSYLVGHDTDRDDIDNTAIEGDTFIKKINKINAKAVLVLLNCCHSGAILSDGYQRTGIPFDKDDFIQKSNRAIITACTNTELAYTSTPLSVFTYALVEGLAGVHLKHSDKKTVTLFDLAMFIREEVVWLSKGKQHPELEVLQSAKTENFEVVNYQNGIPVFVREAFQLYDEKKNALHLEQRGVQPDTAYRDKYAWLGSIKNAAIDSDIEAGGDVTFGDRITGQNGPVDDKYTTKNAAIGSTIKAGGHVTFGDHIEGQNKKADDKYTTKNAVIGSTIKAGGNVRMGDEVISGNQQVNIHNYYNNPPADSNTSASSPTPAIKTRLKSLLSKEKTGEVIEQLLDYSEQKDKDMHQTVLILSARYHRINNQEQRGIIHNQDANVERNRINNTLADLIDDL